MHLIHKEIIELSSTNLTTAALWEGRMHQLQDDMIMPCIRDAFDARATSSHRIVIDRLILDLGVLNLNTTQSELRHRIMNLLETQLDTLQFPANREMRADHDLLTAPENATLVDAFIYYLEFGSRPWWASDNEEWDSIRADELRSLHYTQLLTLLRENRNARIRFINAWPDRMLIAILKQWNPSESTKANTLWEFIQTRSGIQVTAALRVTWFQYWILKVTKASYRDQRFTDIAKFIQEAITRKPFVFRDLLLDNDLPSRKLVRSIDEILRNVDASLRAVVIQACTTQFPDRENVMYDAENRVIENQMPDESLIMNEAGLSISEPLSEKKSSSRPLESNEVTNNISKTEGIDQLVPNAGILLLHLFMAELFRTCGCWSDHGWVDERSRETAVMLLVYCGYGATDIHEDKLLIEKLLCGMLWSDAIFPVELNTDQMYACDALLNAVIGHWKALGNISHDGLRSGFFDREAKVLFKAGKWNITVERKAQDILLSRIPWSLSNIHLPWLGRTYIQATWV